MVSMAARGNGLVGALLREESETGASGWGLTLDAAVAVALTAVAILEVARDVGLQRIVTPEGAFTFATPANRPTAVLAAAALTALPLALRRVYPIGVWLTIVLAILLLRHETVPPVAFATAVFAAYSAVVHSRYRNLALVAVTVVTLAVTATFADTLPRFPGRLSALFAIVPAVAAGLGIRELRRRLNDSTARLRHAAEEREAATRHAIEAERARIAGELHDVVTHSVSVMLVQAGAARTVLASSPGEAEQALLAVEASGRTAMAELRSLLGVLAPTDEDAVLRPQPGLGELDGLIGRVSAAGLPVELRVSGTPRPLPAGADLAAYRVVQEALTNVLRHAAGAATCVMVHWGESLVVTISDSGQGATSSSPGRGLLGLRERLSLYGGELAAGPRPGGGWHVRAVMPLGPMP